MDLESELISLITQLLFFNLFDRLNGFKLASESFTSLITQIISVVSSVDLNLEPKPESEFMSLITKAISVFHSMDFDSQPTPLQELISFISQEISLANYMDSDSDRRQPNLYIREIFFLQPEPELVSLIYQIFLVVITMKSKSVKFISLCPQIPVTLAYGKFLYFEREGVARARSASVIVEEGPWYTFDNRWQCLPWSWVKLKFPGEDTTYFCCFGCGGKNHEEFEKAPIEIKHILHRKHSLQLVWWKNKENRQCYCCDEDLERVFYCCLSCDFTINIICARKPPVLSIDHPKWHEHTLHLFPRHASLNCNLCALADSKSSPFYMCPPCDFVVHLRCIKLPRVIRISRHHHRISFTSSFDHGDFSCGICRTIIDTDYGSYFCSKGECSYAVHSRCATQRNVWDGKELEGEPEEEIEEVEPFVRISDGIIQHFSHQHHHLKLDENTNRDYDENKLCQACITPIYFGKFYSCMQCDFILHEKCANLPRKIYHPIHPHLLTLGYHDNVVITVDDEKKCTACSLLCIAGLLYKCGKEGCDFKLHVQCTTISEPLVHESHNHPLFLTSKPEESRRSCSVCKEQEQEYNQTNETFNCIEECDFALCFGCATLPPKVRYKHDKHVLTLSYGKETSTMTYWCEICERKIDGRKRIYMCDEYCCVTLHIECLLGEDLYMKPGLSWFYYNKEVHVLPNNHYMTRPICSICEHRCPQKIFLQSSGSIFCSVLCQFVFMIRSRHMLK